MELLIKSKFRSKGAVYLFRICNNTRREKAGPFDKLGLRELIQQGKIELKMKEDYPP